MEDLAACTTPLLEADNEHHYSCFLCKWPSHTPHQLISKVATLFHQLGVCVCCVVVLSLARWVNGKQLGGVAQQQQHNTHPHHNTPKYLGVCVVWSAVWSA